MNKVNTDSDTNKRSNQNTIFDTNKFSSVLGGSTSILNTAIDLAQTNDGYDDEIYRVNNQRFSPSGTYSLMNQFNNMYIGTPKSLYDFTGKTGKDYAKGILGATASGALAGSAFGPIGAAIGGGVGFLASGLGALVNNINGNDEYDYYKQKMREAQSRAINNFNIGVAENNDQVYDDALLEYYRSAKYGGELSTHGSDFSNDVKYINVGGTHEKNPNGGVLMGMDENGTPNLVEEGEVIVGDYVFSNRMKPSQSALEKSFLSSSLYGGTYAEIAQKISEQSEESPNDAITKRTLNANLSRLMSIQEDARAKKAQRESNEFAIGGKIRSTGSTWFYNGHAFKSEEEAQRYYDAVNSALEITGNNSVGYKTIDGRVFPNRIVAKRHARQLASDVWTEFKESSSLEKNLELQRPVPSDVSSQATATNFTSVTRSGEPVNTSGQTEETVELAQNTSFSSEPTSRSEEKLPIVTAQDTSQLNEPITSWNDLVSRIGTYGISRNKGNIDGTYRIDNQFPLGQFETIEDLEKSNEYIEFTEYIKNHPDDPNVRRYLKALDDGVADNVERLFDGETLKSNWEDIYERRRNDQKGGIYHFSGNLSDILARSERVPRYNLDLINREKLPGEPTLESVMNVKDPELLDRNRPRPNTYTGPNNIDKIDDGIGSYLRYAPVVGNALALLGNRKDYSDVRRFESMTANPRTVRFSPIGTYIRPNLVAPSELSTPIGNQMAGERNYISNNTLGNSTASNNYMLASDYLGNSRIGAAYLQGKQYNADQRQRAAAYNRGIDQYNSEGAFREQQTNMGLNNYYLNRALQSYQMRNNIDMAYNQARSSNLTAMFNNLGNIGLDTFNRNRSNEVYPYIYTGWAGDIDFDNR